MLNFEQGTFLEAASHLAEIEGNVAVDPIHGLRFGTTSLLPLESLPDGLRRWVCRPDADVALIRADGFDAAIWDRAIRDPLFPRALVANGGSVEPSPARFLLVNSFDPGLEFTYPYPPTIKLAEMLLKETREADARVYDPNLEPAATRRRFPRAPLALYSLLESERIDAIIQTVYNVDFDLRLLCEIRRRCGNAIILLGGPHLNTVNREEYLRILPIDGLILGDGRRALLDLALKLSQRHEIEFRGHANREAPRMIRNQVTAVRSHRGRVKEVLAAHNIWGLQTYEERNPIAASATASDILPYDMVGKRPLSVLTSQRCAKTCYWCRSPKAIPTRDPIEVVDEIEGGYADCDSLHFDDNEIFFDSENFERIADLLIRRGLNSKPVLVKTTTDQMTEERAALLSQVGVQIIAFGVESFSQRCLDLLSKSTSVEDNHRALTITLDHGIKAGINAIWLVPAIDLRTTRILATSIVPYLVRGAYLNLVPELQLGDVRRTKAINRLIDSGHIRAAPRFFEGMLAPLEYFELHLSEAMIGFRDRALASMERSVSARRLQDGRLISIAVRSLYLLRAIVEEIPADVEFGDLEKRRFLEDIEWVTNAVTQAEQSGRIHALSASHD